MARETSQTFDRGLQLLELLAAADDALSVTDLAETLGVARPVVYRFLATLEDHGLAVADDAGRYRAGLGLARLTGSVVPALRATAEPHLRVLADTVGATAHLTLAEGDDGIAIAVVEPSATSVHVAYRTGRRHPLARGAAGRAILGARSGRPKRWYVTSGELESGATGLAAPLGLDGVEACVGVVTLGTIAERTIGPAVVRAAEAIRSARAGPPRPCVSADRTLTRRHRGHERSEGVRRRAARQTSAALGYPVPAPVPPTITSGGELMSRRTVGIVLAAIGVVGIVGSVVWEHVAEPKLVKYPTDVDESPEYEGTVKIFLDPKTYQPLDPALEAPLHVVRHIKALGNESTDSKVVLSEKIDLTAEGQFTGGLDAQYVMDRTTINNVPDDRAWAFTPDNVVDRSPAFRLAFPFDTKAEPTLIYKNEIAATYMAQPAGEGEAAGLHVINFTGEQATPVPASPAYIAAISKFNPLPSELTLDQLKPVLKAKGLDVDALLPQLLPNLTPDDTNSLLALAAAPIKLQYLFSFSGADSVEPSTGSIVEVHDVIETLYVAPDPTVLPKLREVLARYPNVPAAVQGVTALDQLAAQPIMVFQNSFSQTDASVADVAKTVKDAKKLKDLATTAVPNALRYGGIGLTVLGLLLALVPKRSSRRGKGGAPKPDEQPVEVRLAPGEQVVITEPTPADPGPTDGAPADVAPTVADPPGTAPPPPPGPAG